MTWQAKSPRRARLPTDWASRTRDALERDHRTCRIRSPRCITTATEVDHINPGDDHDLTNLQAVCTPCHRWKTSREGVDARPARARPAPVHPARYAPSHRRSAGTPGGYPGPPVTPEHRSA